MAKTLLFTITLSSRRGLEGHCDLENILKSQKMTKDITLYGPSGTICPILKIPMPAGSCFQALSNW